MAVSPGLRLAAGIKKGDSMTVQREKWSAWNSLNAEGKAQKLGEENDLPQGLKEKLEEVRLLQESQKFTKQKGLEANSIQDILKKNEPLSENDYIKRRFGSLASVYSNAAYHRAPRGRSKGAKKDMQQDLIENGKLYSAVRNQGKEEYQYLLKAGKIQPETKLAALERKAKGDSSLETVQAAQRVLEKRKARMLQATK